MNKNIDYYLGLPYNYVIKHIVDESGSYYFGKILELDGCQSDGETIDELYENLKEALEIYIETKLEGGFNIPKPSETDKYSGKFNVRLPKSLHEKLAIEADSEGISLNQYVMYKLAK